MRILIVLAALFFVLPTTQLSLPGINLDASWGIALQVAHEKNFIFGRDFIFTYGPLGFLSTRIAAESTKTLIILYDLFLTLQLIFIPFLILRIAPSVFTAIAIFMAYFTIGNAYYLFESATLLFLLSTFWAFYDKFKYSNLAYLLSLLNALLCFYVKVNLGLAALLQIFAIVLLSMINRKTSPRPFVKFVATLMAIFLSTLLVNVDFFEYIRASLHIANGYNDAMYLKTTDISKLYTACSLLILLVLTCCVSYIKEKYFLLVVSCLGFSFLLFKQAFVRADEHVFVFFDYISIPFAMLAIFAEKRLRAFNSLIFIGVSAFLLYNRSLSTELFSNRYHAIFAYIESMQSKIKLPAVSPPLQPSIISAIGGSSVDLMPDNTALLYYSGLNYLPRPVIQSYTAYDSYLDNVNASFMRLTGRDKMLISHGCVDYRYCLYDETETKIALMEHYEFTRKEGEYILLTRKITPSPFKRKLIQKGSHKLESEFKLKNTGSIQLVKFNVSYSPKGKLTRFFYKPPPLNMQIETKKERLPYRAVVPILQAGVIANLDIKDSESLAKFFKGDFQAITPVESIRFQTDFNWAYNKEFDYEIYELSK